MTRDLAKSGLTLFMIAVVVIEVVALLSSLGLFIYGIVYMYVGSKFGSTYIALGLLFILIALALLFIVIKLFNSMYSLFKKAKNMDTNFLIRNRKKIFVYSIIVSFLSSILLLVPAVITNTHIENLIDQNRQ